MWRDLKMCSLLLLIILASIYARSVFEYPKPTRCDPDTIVAYKMIMKTFWTEENFPKSYPTWRPPAQWSTTFGQTHGEDYNIFRLGQQSSPALQQFAEREELLQLAASGTTESIYDQFISEAIKQGAGESMQDFFVDGNHSMVSVVSKLVPSPDWFVGVDGYNFCDNGEWVDSVTISVDPLDAGTDGGLTFTSPHWKSRWPLEISHITSRYPAHRAASFYYPELERLPKIASFQFIKLEEFSLEKLINDSKFEQHHINSNDPIDFIGDTEVELTASYVNDWNEYDTYRNPSIQVQIPHSKQSLLGESTSEILSNVTASYEHGDGFYPKLFRPKIHEEILQKRIYSPHDSSNLMTSFFNRKNPEYNPPMSPTRFDW